MCAMAARGTMNSMNDASRPTADVGQYRALVVDDETALAEVVASYLTREHFDTRIAHTGPDALTLARTLDPDVVILDLGLPGIDGLEVCRHIRTFSDAYVVILTARDTEIDTIVGLTVGADDYVTKPFSPHELVARIHAMLRRPRTGPCGAAAAPSRSEAVDIGALHIDVAAREVLLHDQPIMLTRMEFDLLATLAARPCVVMTRRQLLEVVRDGPWVGNDHLVDVHFGHVRRKLGDDPAAPRYVVTVRGVGYRIGTGR